MDFDLEAQADAAEELAPKPQGSGQAVTLTWQATGTYDPSEGEITTPDPVYQSCSGIEEQYRAFDIDGTLIRTGDTKFMLSPLTTFGAVVNLYENEAGTMTMTLADGSTKTVQRVEPYRPAGALVYAYLQLRGA